MWSSQSCMHEGLETMHCWGSGWYLSWVRLKVSPLPLLITSWVTGGLKPDVHSWVHQYEMTLGVSSWYNYLVVLLIHAKCHLKFQTVNSSGIHENIYYKYMHENVNSHSAFNLFRFALKGRQVHFALNNFSLKIKG